jgi:hypothetical protein
MIPATRAADMARPIVMTMRPGSSCRWVGSIIGRVRPDLMTSTNSASLPECPHGGAANNGKVHARQVHRLRTAINRPRHSRCPGSRRCRWWRSHHEGLLRLTRQRHGSNTSLNAENVIIRNNAGHTKRLTGWTPLDRGSIHVYAFPRFKLKAGATVRVHTPAPASTRLTTCIGTWATTSGPTPSTRPRCAKRPASGSTAASSVAPAALLTARGATGLQQNGELHSSLHLCLRGRRQPPDRPVVNAAPAPALTPLWLPSGHENWSNPHTRRREPCRPDRARLAQNGPPFWASLVTHGSVVVITGIPRPLLLERDVVRPADVRGLASTRIADKIILS